MPVLIFPHLTEYLRHHNKTQHFLSYCADYILGKVLKIFHALHVHALKKVVWEHPTFSETALYWQGQSIQAKVPTQGRDLSKAQIDVTQSV